MASGPPVTPSSMPPDGSFPSDEDRSWGMLAHLSPFIGGLVGLPFLGPLVVYFMYKDRSAFVTDQARESLNFQLAILVAVLVCTATCIGILVLPVILVGGLIYQIIAAIEANKGVAYRYPYTIRFIN